MAKVMLVAGLAKHIPIIEGMDYIGVDYGAVCCLRQKLPLVLAVGDFDSTTKEELDALKKNCKVHQLPIQKNETDSEEAIRCAMELGYDEIILYGGLGGRLDHELANLHLLLYRDLPLTLMNEHNVMKVLLPGSYTIQKQYRYLSFFAIEESVISESGVAYPLYEKHLRPRDIFAVSNEISQQEAQIIVHEGKVLMIQSDDENA